MKKLSLLILPIAAMLLTACEKKEDTKKIERCIDQICEKVAYDGEKLYLLTTLNVHSKDGQSVKMYTNHHVEIPAEEVPVDVEATPEAEANAEEAVAEEAEAPAETEAE